MTMIRERPDQNGCLFSEVQDVEEKEKIEYLPM